VRLIASPPAANLAEPAAGRADLDPSSAGGGGFAAGANVGLPKALRGNGKAPSERL